MVPAPKTASPTAPPVSSCTVPPALGAISCVAASPARHLLAVGTDRGAVLVWDVSSDTPAAPLFQVCGRGGGGADNTTSLASSCPPQPLSGVPPVHVVLLQVSGMGAVYKQSGWWKPWQDSTQQQPAITGKVVRHSSA
jgi:hypothetical protein